MSKACSRCKEDKPLSEYGKHRGRKDGLHYYCRQCARDKDLEINHALNVDHCHNTGKVRQLLCNKCNQALGLLNDNESLLLKAARYIRSHNE